MIELLEDPREFAARAGALIEARIEDTVLATVLQGILSGRFPDVPPRFAVVTGPDRAVTGAALRTPPWPLVCTELGGGDAFELMRAWLPVDPELDAVNAQAHTSRALAAAAAALTGALPELQARQALHALDPDGLRAPPRPAAGRLRAPSGEEIERCVGWEQQFAGEAGLAVRSTVAERMARQRIAAGRGYVWDAGASDGIVSYLGHTPAVGGVPRVGPVYAPPRWRSRGYASSAVAALGRRLFDAGARRIVLFADLANPTSNKIYADVGFRRVGDWEIIALKDGRSGPTTSADG